MENNDPVWESEETTYLRFIPPFIFYKHHFSVLILFLVFEMFPVFDLVQFKELERFILRQKSFLAGLFGFLCQVGVQQVELTLQKISVNSSYL